MAWIEFHPERIIRLQKFGNFRKALNWSDIEALGFLGLFWGQVIDLRESGDISGWKAEYIVELTRTKTSPEKLWIALLGGWVDSLPDNRFLVHDWLDYAGRYLETKYRTSHPTKLVEIWSLHGKEYSVNERRTKDRPKSDFSQSTLPILSLPKEKDTTLSRFKTFWEQYPRKKSLGTAERAWLKIKPSEEMVGRIMAALNRAKTSVGWLEKKFIPYPATWLNARGWEDENEVTNVEWQR